MLSSKLMISFLFKWIESTFISSDVIFDINIDITFSTWCLSLLYFTHNVIANFNCAGGSSVCCRWFNNDWILLQVSKHLSSLLLSIFCHGPLKSLINIILSETMLNQSEKLKGLPFSKVDSLASLKLRDYLISFEYWISLRIALMDLGYCYY